MDNPNRLVRGQHNKICDRTGFKIKSHTARKEWTTSVVRRDSWESRQPQDMIRSQPDNQIIPDPRSQGQGADTFLIGTVSSDTLTEVITDDDSGFDIEALCNYTSKTLDIADLTGLSGASFFPSSINIKTDGMRFYVNAAQNGDILVMQFDLSTAYDISTASHSGTYTSTVSETENNDVIFKPDGMKMWLLDFDLETMSAFSLSSAWDVTTASFDSVDSILSTINAGISAPHSIQWNDDGTKLFILNDSPTNEIYVFSLTNAYDISTLADTGDSHLITGDGLLSPRSMRFNPDGTILFILDSFTDKIHSYSLSTGFDITTVTYDELSCDVSNEDATPISMAVSTDGLHLYMGGAISKLVHQYE